MKILIGAVCFLLGAVGIVFAQATGLRPDQFIALPWTWSGLQTFGQVQGTSTLQTGVTYTFAASDCGTSVFFNNSTGTTATIPASIAPASGTICNIGVNQVGSGRVSVSGAAVTPASLLSANGFTGTSGVAGAVIILEVTTVGGTPTAILMGNGS